jgi:release factor glutamine methyltransferase
MTEWHPLRSPNDGGSKSWQSLNDLAENRARNAASAEMPSLNHAKMKDFEQVYEPSDDTYLLIDGVQADLSQEHSLRAESCSRTVLEIGCGSGVPIVYLAKSLDASVAFATDINLNALHFTQQTAAENGVKILETIQCDLGSALLPRCEQLMDVIIFNPPYVPTPDDEVSGNGIEASWAGGEKGRRVIDRAIPQIVRLLSRPHGVCYMITVDDNEPEEIAKLFSQFGLTMAPLVRRRACNEYLTVQKITPIRTAMNPTC